jgi:hypothetical protein
MGYVEVSITEHSQPKGIKLKMRRNKLRRDLYWQGVLMQKGINKWGIKKWLCEQGVKNQKTTICMHRQISQVHPLYN